MQIKNMRFRFYKIVFLAFLFCGKLVAQEKELLDSAGIEAAYTYMDLKEALEHPEMVIRLELKKQKLKTFPPEIFQFKNLHRGFAVRFYKMDSVIDYELLILIGERLH